MAQVSSVIYAGTKLLDHGSDERSHAGITLLWCIQQIEQRYYAAHFNRLGRNLRATIRDSDQMRKENSRHVSTL